MGFPSLNKMNFLVVDDMDNMRRSIRAMLKLVNCGKDFYEAGNGRDALKVLEGCEEPIHFIISDWNMPHMNGTQLLNHIRASHKFRDIPFLMITAEANVEIVAEAAENDVDAYLTKPFVTASLEQKIKELLHSAANPDPYSAHLKKARELEEKGDLAGAIAETKKAAEIKRGVSRPLRELGRLYLKKNDMKQALLCFQNATEINRLDVTSYHYLGQIYYRMGKTDKAIEFFSRAMDINPRHSDRAFNFANLLLKKKKLKEAEKILVVVLRNNPANFDLREDIAETCNENGLYALAIKTYQELLRDDPERAYLNKKLGMALYRDGDRNESFQILEKAVVKFGDDIELLMFLANAYYELKMPVRAEKWATQVIRIDPEHKEAKEILDKCL